MKNRLDADVKRLSDQARQLFEHVSKPIAKLACVRSEEKQIEWVFVVAQAGERVLIYDDVEDEYAVGILLKAGPLLDWTLTVRLM